MAAITESAADRAEDERGRPHYHPIGIFFHWAMAALLLFQLGWGWWVSSLPAGYDKLAGYAIHALVGLALLSLAFMRAGWRMIAPFILPELEKPEDLPGWQRLAAELTHFALYCVMFALPVTGWLMISQTAGEEIVLPLGWSAPVFPLPVDLSFIERAQLEQRAETAHLVLVWITTGLLAMHIGAALKHQFIDKDTVLARMIPWLFKTKPRP
ncbi:MAG TPA: cytochrome b [Candidatus Binatia bacterium]|nr:cytochrome b [Candidatus Binatia bacterium]